jgi:hypothetical protein
MTVFGLRADESQPHAKAQADAAIRKRAGSSHSATKPREQQPFRRLQHRG